MKKTTYWSW